MTGPVMNPPSGVVTFLFTDIEGSTRLFRRFGDAYVDLLRRHNSLLSDAWAQNGGFEVSTEGDSYFVAFSDPGDAVRAAAAAQRSLGSEDWPEGGVVKVRIGLHTGLASPRERGYVSLAVHQAARVMAAAHGGQVLVSADTIKAIDGPLGGDLHLDLLGRFQLRSFEEPQPLYQLAGPGLESSFPAVRALPTGHHNIVRPPTGMIGRDSFVEAVAAQVGARRLITLLGPGGIGKTTVATEIGIRLADEWDDGVWLSDLAGVEDDSLVASVVATAVGAANSPTRGRWDDVLEHLSMRRAVVILDNCESVLGACAELVVSLQAHCPEVAVIATSRAPLGVPGEVLWHVAPLDVPDEGMADPAAVLATSGGRLFIERARAARPEFQIDDSNAAEIAEIVRRLDGLPLSLELAAARLAIQSPAEIRDGLDDRFSLLRSPRPVGRAGHTSIEELLDWSYDGLEAREQAAFRRLAIFSGGFTTRTASAAVAGPDIAASDVPLLILSLADRSLLMADLAANETRYRLMETYRAYGRRLLDETDETRSTAIRLAAEMLQRAGPWLAPDERWHAEVGAEAANLRGLISVLPAASEDTAQQIACAIGRYHDASQTFRDGVDELGRYAGTLTSPTPDRVALLVTLADLHLRMGDVGAAKAMVADAASLRDESGAPAWDDVGVDRTLGEVARRSGDLVEALRIASGALERDLSDRGRLRMYNLLGSTSAAMGDMDGALEACHHELELSEALGQESHVASAHGNLAEIAMRMGDVPEAARHQRASLDAALSQGAEAFVAFSLIMAARVAGSGEHWVEAAALHARAEAMLDDLGLQLYDDDRRHSDELIEAARSALGDGPFGAADAEGRSLDVADAIDRANRIFDDAVAM